MSEKRELANFTTVICINELNKIRKEVDHNVRDNEAYARKWITVVHVGGVLREIVMGQKRKSLPRLLSPMTLLNDRECLSTFMALYAFCNLNRIVIS